MILSWLSVRQTLKNSVLLYFYVLLGKFLVSLVFTAIKLLMVGVVALLGGRY